MEKPVSLVMTRMVWTVDCEDTIDKVDAVLASHKISAVPVVDKQGALFGIISSRDLLQFFASRRNPRAVRAWELCTYKPITISHDTPVSEVAKIMLDRKIHHLLITEDGEFCGIVSAMDFVAQCFMEREQFDVIERGVPVTR